MREKRPYKAKKERKKMIFREVLVSCQSSSEVHLRASGVCMHTMLPKTAVTRLVVPGVEASIEQKAIFHSINGRNSKI